MTITIPQRYANDISVVHINEIIRLLKLPSIYSVKYEKRYGRYILIEHNNKRDYVIFTPNAVGGRNAFLAQYIPTALTAFVSDKMPNKNIYIYLLNTSSYAKTKFQVDIYRMVKTLGFTILNEKDLGIKILPYSSFQEWKNNKEVRRSANTGNLSSFAIEDEGAILFYAKLFGANGKEATLTACVLSVLAQKEMLEFRYIQVKEHDVEEISDTDKVVLGNYGINTSDVSIYYPSIGTVTTKRKSTCRDQDAFKFNLYQKFGPKKCYLCNCDIETNIIASHIHRIADIEHSTLSLEKKKEQAIDGDNGFWLCANHDKLFEYGQISFDKKGVLRLSKNLGEHQVEFVQEITKVTLLDKEHITKKFLHYLTIHNHRLKFSSTKV